MLKKILFSIFIALCLAAGIYWFTYTKEIRTPVSSGINAIPINAAVIFESKQAKNTWKKLSQTNIMWEELLGTKTFAALNLQIKYIDSILQLNPEISNLLDDHSIFISAHPSGVNSFDFLFVYSLPNLSYKSELHDFLLKLNNGREIIYQQYDDADIGTIKSKDKDSLTFSFLNGTLMMSTKQMLVEDAIRQLKSAVSLAKDKNFSKVLTTAGKKVDANVYVNYKYLPSVLKNFIFPTYKDDLNSISDFANCSGWDVSFKPNALMLSGFTYSNDSTPTNYLNIFNRQKPQNIELTNIISSKTAFMIFYGLSNVKGFHRDYKNHLSAKLLLQSYNQFVQDVNQKYKINIEQKMLDWIDNEMALVITESSNADFSANTFGVFHSNNINDALNTLGILSDSINNINKEKYDTSSFKGHIINKLNIPGLLPQLFGKQFSRLRNCVFTSVKDYIVFGNSEDALHNFINDFENNKILANDKNYSAFAENMSAEANIYIYSSIARSPQIYSNFVTEELSKDFENKLELFHKFEAAGIQFSFNNKLYYSNLYLKYNPVYKKETGTLWESELDTTVSSRPYLLINHNTKAREVLIQDDANKIYLISNTGKVIWTKQLHEKIMSDVTQLDVLKNNKLQMIFNTRSYIYLFDRNGNDMKGFPIELKSPATNSVSIVDYENNRDYRIFISCENKKTFCFKTDGELVSGFKFEKTNDVVYMPVQYRKMNGMDNLFIIDVTGKIYILDRHGEARVKLKEQAPYGIRNFYVEPGKDLSKTFIIASDTLGNITRIGLDGNKEKIKFQDFETSPYFEYRDLNNDKTKEYIFLSRTELKVFNADRSLLFEYEFKSSVTHAPEIFTFPDGTSKIGVVSEAENEIYLFNPNGSLYNLFPLTGKTPFSIGDLNNEGAYNLITGSPEKSIYVYQLE
jgi:hypothetical protein